MPVKKLWLVVLDEGYKGAEIFLIEADTAQAALDYVKEHKLEDSESDKPLIGDNGGQSGDNCVYQVAAEGIVRAHGLAVGEW